MTIPSTSKVITRYRKSVLGAYETVKFKRTEVASAFYESRHAVDDNNNLRQGRASIESTWLTHQWFHRTLAFIIGVCETNAYSCYRFFNLDESKNMSHFEFRIAICQSILVETSNLLNAEMSESHELVTYSNTEVFRNGRWKQRSRARSLKNQFRKRCRSCPGLRKISTYCACSPQNGMCKECWAKHIVEVYSK
jgi:hypothetical protein